MENKYRVNLLVDTDIPAEFLFMFFVPTIQTPDLALKDITITMIKIHREARVLEEGPKWRDSFRFVSFSQVLREMPELEKSDLLPDKDFSQKMRLRFEDAKRKTLEKITTLFVIDSKREDVFMVYEDFRVKWKKGQEKEQELWTPVQVGLAIAPKNTRPF